MKRITYKQALREIETANNDVIFNIEIAMNITHREQGVIPSPFTRLQALDYVKRKYDAYAREEIPLEILLGDKSLDNKLVFIVEQDREGDWNYLFFRYGWSSNSSSEFEGRPFPYRKPFSSSIVGRGANVEVSKHDRCTPI